MSVPEWTLKMSDGEYLTLRANTAALERSELEEMAAMWVAQHTTECPVDVPEHYRMKRDGELV